MFQRAFTLIEILIVVIIIGILAAIVVPSLTHASTDARNVTFKANLRDLIQVASLYYEEHGALPPQEAAKPLPAVLFENAGRTNSSGLVTPLGGYWHIGKFDDVDRWGVGIWWPGEEADVLSKVKIVDEDLDDGVGTTGKFQNRDERYYWLIN